MSAAAPNLDFSGMTRMYLAKRNANVKRTNSCEKDPELLFGYSNYGIEEESICSIAGGTTGAKGTSGAAIC